MVLTRMRFILYRKGSKEKKVGARARLHIIEDFVDIMYEIPKDDNIGMVTHRQRLCREKGWSAHYDARLCSDRREAFCNLKE